MKHITQQPLFSFCNWSSLVFLHSTSALLFANVAKASAEKKLQRHVGTSALRSHLKNKYSTEWGKHLCSIHKIFGSAGGSSASAHVRVHRHAGGHTHPLKSGNEFLASSFRQEWHFFLPQLCNSVVIQQVEKRFFVHQFVFGIKNIHNCYCSWWVQNFKFQNVILFQMIQILS